MAQVDINAPQEICWQCLSEPEDWHRWAPWLPLDIGRPMRGARVRTRWVHLPLPGKITVWSPQWRWDWRWGALVWRHQVDKLDDGNSRVTVDISGPGSGLVGAFYGPIMSLALRRLKRLAEARADG